MGFDDFRDEESQRRMMRAREAGAFESRASIFDYLYFTEGLSLEEAEEKAKRLAEIRGVPDVSDKPKTGVESYLDKAEVVFKVAEKYPVVRDLIVSFVSAGIGAIGGAAYEKDKLTSQNQIPPQPNIYNQLNTNIDNEPAENI